MNPNEPGSVLFTNNTFPTLEEDAKHFLGKMIGEGYCANPYLANSFFNITGMSYGALGKTAVESLAKGSTLANIWMNTGEGGYAPVHDYASDIIFQIGSAKYGVCDENGDLDEGKLREMAQGCVGCSRGSV